MSEKKDFLCPIINASCCRELCEFWVEAGNKDFSACSVRLIAKQINRASFLLNEQFGIKTDKPRR